MRIAYIGPEWGTSMHRANALERLGHQVTIIDPWAWLGNSAFVKRWIFHLGGIGVGMFINQRIYQEVYKSVPELIWVAQGPFLSPTILKQLKSIGVPIVNYTDDDPFSKYDRMRFYYYRKAVPLYDLIVVVRKENIEEAKRAGAKKVLRVWRSADEIAHRPRNLTQSEKDLYASEVAFIGTWIHGRSPFLAEIIRLGIRLSIWGDNWHKAHEWSIIQPYWRGPGLHDNQSYAAAILSSKICLGLLNKRNRDLHTFRSNEIPALGGLLCAERTIEHMELYEEGVEAVFWNSAEECADKCRELLTDDEKRAEIARRGHERARRNNLFNEPIMASIIKKVTN
jgi:spore maturation protein CgeB